MGTISSPWGENEAKGQEGANAEVINLGPQGWV